MLTSPDYDYTQHRLRREAEINGIRRKAKDLINALHDLDGSPRGGGFNSASLGRARDAIEAAVDEVTR